MSLKKITLENFRNHARTSVEIDSHNTFLVGDNGSGKTNILEAIYSFAILKPFRTNKRESFIQKGQDYARVVLENESKLEIFWDLNPPRTVFKKNDIKLKTSDFLQEKQFFAVLFNPNDLNLPFIAPSKRRPALARPLLSVDRKYFEAQIEFDKVLKRRNKLLQDEAPPSEFEFWNEKFCQMSSILTAKRRKFTDYLNSKVRDYFQKISHSNDKLYIEFYPSTEDLAGDLQKNFQKELIIGRTLKGAHRDDFVFYLRDKLLAEQGSRGEIRSAILALRLAERDFIIQESGNKPLLLFDDVFSELDNEHREQFMNLIKNEQAVITTTDPLQAMNKIYRVENGEVT